MTDAQLAAIGTAQDALRVALLGMEALSGRQCCYADLCAAADRTDALLAEVARLRVLVRNTANVLDGVRAEVERMRAALGEGS